jgi:hypothetical protein
MGFQMNFPGIFFGIIGFLILFTLVSIIIGIIALLLYLISIPIRKGLKVNGKLQENVDNKIKWIFVGVTILVSFYLTYEAIFPSNSFFIKEFTTVTAKKFPKSAVFLGKTSSYPDFHGDYSSCSIIKLSKEDYTRLYDEIKNDTTMKIGEIIASHEITKISKGIDVYNSIEAGFIRPIPGEGDHYYYIGFFRGSTNIIVLIYVT